MTTRYLKWHARSVSSGRRTRNELGKREYRNFLNLIELYLDKKPKLNGVRLLDVGSADNHFINSIGQDMQTEAVTGEFIDLNVDPLPYANDHFDFVTSFACIEHVHRTFFFLDELRRVLKPGGIVFITTPNWRYSYKIFFDDATHYIPFTPERLEAALNICGFGDVQTYPGLRLKPRFLYTNRFRFFFAACLPFTGDSFLRNIFPFLCGRAISVIGIAKKRTVSSGKRSSVIETH